MFESYLIDHVWIKTVLIWWLIFNSMMNMWCVWKINKLKANCSIYLTWLRWNSRIVSMNNLLFGLKRNWLLKFTSWVRHNQSSFKPNLGVKLTKNTRRLLTLSLLSCINFDQRLFLYSIFPLDSWMTWIVSLRSIEH